MKHKACRQPPLHFHSTGTARGQRIHSFFVLLMPVFLTLVCVSHVDAQETMIVLPDATESTMYNVPITTSGTAPYSWTLLERNYLSIGRYPGGQ